jgi:hypothetical protein
MAKTLTTMAALVATTAALAQPLPHPKTGQCSGGYMRKRSAWTLRAAFAYAASGAPSMSSRA